MAAWGALGPGTRVLVLVAGGSVVAGAGYLLWQSAYPAEVAASAEPEPQASDAQDDTAGAAVKTAEPATIAEAKPPVLPERDLPAIDTWRVAPDGEALVAGVAAPMAEVTVLVDGVKVAKGDALASGEFALQFTLAPNPAPSLMTLSMTEPGKTEVVSDALVALGPIAGPPTVQTVSEAEVAAGAGAETAADTEVAAASEAALAPDALLVTAEGAVVLQEDVPADPALMTQVMIDTITYTPAGAVQVGGRGAAGSTVRIYLDNAEVAMLAVPATGKWISTLGDTAPGIYTLRVDQTDGTGKVTSRFETPFQRETLEALAIAAGQQTPVDNAAVAPSAKVTPVEPPAAAPAEELAAAALTETSPQPTPEAAVVPEIAPEPIAEPIAEPGAASVVTSPESEESKELAEETVALAEVVPEPRTEPQTEPQTESRQPVTVTVQPGFTLWGIAQDRLGDGVLYVQVFDANRDKIKNPDLIYPGQVLSVPATP